MVESIGTEVGTKAKAGKLMDNHQDNGNSAKFGGGENHTPDHPDASYINAVKAKLSKGLDGQDQIGQDSDNNGSYKGKSLELGQGGRSLMMEDRISMELVTKGYSIENAKAIANKQMKVWASKKYSPEQIKSWQKPVV